jgi:Cu-Zn family superoxide dismutase
MKRALASVLLLAAVAAMGCDRSEAPRRGKKDRIPFEGLDKPETHAPVAPAVATEQPAAERAKQEVTHAIARLDPLGKSTVKGTVHFEQTERGVRVRVDFQGLEPSSAHGFHVHEYGDCTAPDGESAGAHYGAGGPHGLPPKKPRHPGDMGNLKADASGNVRYEATFDTMSIAGDDNPILGRAVILHEKLDRGTQPSGDAGGRIGCGVIGVAAGP